MSRRGVFSLVYALMLFDFIDRQLLVSMYPYLKAEWALSDARLGALATVVSLAIGAGAIPASFYFARWPRVRVMGAMAMTWSAATALGAAATGYWQLFASRFVVGAAQAGYAAIAGTVLSDAIAPRYRSTSLGALLSTAIFGSVIGIWLGGVLALRYGWRAGVVVVGTVSLLLSFVLFSTRERAVPAVAQPMQADDRPGREPLLSPTMVLVYAGFTVMSMIAGTVIAWLPSLFHRGMNIPVDRAGLLAASVMVSSGFGCLLFAWISDRFAGMQAYQRLLLASWTALLSAALLAPAFSEYPGRLQYFLTLAAAFMLLAHIGPVLAVITSLPRASQRTTAIAILVTAQNLVGFAGGPLLAGWLSDRIGLGSALQVIAVTGAAAGVVFAIAGALQHEGMRRRALAA